MKTNKVKFFISHSLNGIIRNKKRYLLFGIVVFIVSSVVIGALMISIGSGKFIKALENDPKYIVYFNGAGVINIDMQDEYNRLFKLADSINVTSNILIIAFSLIGTITIVFITLLLQNERICEIGILYTLGMNKTYIFLSMFFETAIFVLAIILLGIFGAASALYVIISYAVPHELSGYIIFGTDFYINILITTIALIMIPSGILFFKLSNSSPLDLLK